MCFFVNDPATTEIYTLSLHDALPIYRPPRMSPSPPAPRPPAAPAPPNRSPRSKGCPPPPPPGNPPGKPPGRPPAPNSRDRKSTRLNSSHANISYAVFCLKKKKQHTRL